LRGRLIEKCDNQLLERSDSRAALIADDQLLFDVRTNSGLRQHVTQGPPTSAPEILVKCPALVLEEHRFVDVQQLAYEQPEARSFLVRELARIGSPDSVDPMEFGVVEH